jgi:hypothetical protein
MKGKKIKAGKSKDIKTLEQFEQFRMEYGHKCIFKEIGRAHV